MSAAGPTAARRALVSGRVQGVGFRWHAREQARVLGLAGWIRNLADGRVEAWIEGEAASVEAMIAWLRRGPPGARVADVEAVEEPPAGASRFEVR